MTKYGTPAVSSPSRRRWVPPRSTWAMPRVMQPSRGSATRTRTGAVQGPLLEAIPRFMTFTATVRLGLVLTRPRRPCPCRRQAMTTLESLIVADALVDEADVGVCPSGRPSCRPDGRRSDVPGFRGTSRWYRRLSAEHGASTASANVIGSSGTLARDKHRLPLLDGGSSHVAAVNSRWARS